MSTSTQNPSSEPAADLDKAYDPHGLERHLYATWEQAGYFAPQGTGPAYCIMLPPPNVTGTLHMGHGFNQTIMDALTRYHRMCGNNTLWQPGTDHAGIATQMVVERQLQAEGKTRHDLGRDAFIERVWKWKAHSGDTITRQSRRMGASLDWSRECFTMDPGLSQAVTEVFVRLYDEGLIYRGKRLVNWDPVLHTAVSDLEVLAEEETGHLWHIRYPVVGSKEYLVVATTRPETLLGDAAVAVHPEDSRYQQLIGKQVELPLTGRRIPVIADEYVDKDFGSGCVKITPAHDFNDYEVGKRHHLPLINIFTPNAEVDLPGSAYHQLDRYVARKRIIADLETQGLLEKTDPHKLMVPRGDRSGAVIEPYLTDQWYVKVAPLAGPAMQAVENGDIRFVPDNWKNTYFEWMRNIQDWCISRQIWWGHRIPAWYDTAGKIYVARSEDEVREKYKLASGVPLRQDNDVLDTWFSSALWPFSTLGWPQATPEFKTFYPTNVLVTGFDIIFFWVARMIMLGIKFTGEVPFKEVYIHGLVRDSHGQKMSKSKGNVLDPLDLIDGIDLESLIKKRTSGLMQPDMAPKIEKATRKEFPAGIPAYGTDALRMTFASLATQGRDIKFDLGRIEGYRNFCNKLWNAARYVLMNTEGQDCGLHGETELSLADRWIITRLQQVEAEVAEAFNSYRFDLAAQGIYRFMWDEYCSWYLELSKVVLTNPNSSPAALRGTRRTLVQVLETSLRLLHPLMPFITEALWQRVAPLAGIPTVQGQGQVASQRYARGQVASQRYASSQVASQRNTETAATIMRAPYPQADQDKIDTNACEEMNWLMAVIVGVRNIRGERDISPGKVLPVFLQDGTDQDKKYLAQHRAYLEGFGRLSPITWLKAGEEAPESVLCLVDKMKVLVPLGSLIDKQQEMQRLKKEIDKTEKELTKARAKLANPDFIARAPKPVVEQEQQRIKDFESALAILTTQQVKVAALPE